MAIKSTEYLEWSKGDTERNRDYPVYVWYFLASGLAVLVMTRMILALERHLIRTARSRTRLVQGVSSSRNVYNKYIGFLKVSSLLSSFHLGDLLLFSIYSVVIITFTFNDTPDSPAPIHYGYANRSGMITFATIPFIVALAGRNNLISFILGIPYERLRVYHFWCSRLTLLTTLTHAIGRFKISTIKTWSSNTNIWGLVGFIAGCLIFLGSFSFMMKSRYEIFFIFHLIMVIIYIVGSWYHQPDNRQWLYGAVAVWALDRLFRVIRVVAYNGMWRFKDVATSEAKVIKVSDDTVRVELVRPDFPKWLPGSHAFISSIGLHWFPQGHPFTIASIPETSSSQVNIISEASLIDSEKKASTISSSSEKVQIGSMLVFIIRVRDGWTRHLLQFAETQEQNQRLRLLVDGPYSPPDPVDHFEKVILFAGGSGVSWTLPILLDLIARLTATSHIKVKSLVWVWIIKDQSHLSWIRRDLSLALTTLQASPSPKLQLSIQVFATNGQTSSDFEKQVDSSTLAFHSDSLSQLERFKFFNLKVGQRPDVSKLLERSISDAEERRVFVGSSGPSGMSDSLRETCRKLMRGGIKGARSLDLEFKAEEFGW